MLALASPASLKGVLSAREAATFLAEGFRRGGTEELQRRIDAGELELRQDWVDLREIVARVVSAVRRRGAAQKFETNLPPDLPLVKADATLVDQVITYMRRSIMTIMGIVFGHRAGR